MTKPLTDVQLAKALKRKGLVLVHLYGRGERVWVPRAVADEIEARARRPDRRGRRVMRPPMDDLPVSVQRAIWRLREAQIDPDLVETIALAASGLAVARIEATLRAHWQARVTALQSEVKALRAEVARLRASQNPTT